MKCVHCGAPITLEDKKCPYCGEVNKLFEKHQADMEKYAADYEETAQKVSHASRRFASLTVPVVAIAVMLVLNLLMIVLLFQADSIGYRVHRNRVNRIAEASRPQLIAFLEAGDYLSFDAYYNEKSFHSADSLRDLNAVQSATSYFQNFCSTLEQIEVFDDATYREQRMVRLASYLLEIFNIEQTYGQYDAETYLSEENLRYIHEIQDTTKAILMERFAVSEEMADNISDYSESKIASLLMEGAA